jgi:hypothetical protein
MHLPSFLNINYHKFFSFTRKQDINETITDKGSLPPGVYLYNLTNGRKIIGKGKFIIE